MLRGAFKLAPTRLAALLPARTKPRALHVLAPRLATAKPVVTNSGPNQTVRIDPAPRLNESIDQKRARLLWQSRKRGILETCVLLGRFAREYLPTLTAQELEDYDEFMNENDWDIYYWITETPDAPTPCPEHWKSKSIFEKLRKVGRNENNEIMRQPDLY